MDNDEEEDQKVKYWRTKYELLAADFGRTKERTESLEDRLLEIVEENERREKEKDERIRQLDGELDESRRRIEQLEAACFRYKNQGRMGATSTQVVVQKEGEVVGDEEDEKENVEKEKKAVEVEDLPQRISTMKPISIETPRSSIDGITRSPDFHAGEHVICEYHKLPVLAKNEGFIYGFRWGVDSKIHVV